MDREVAGEGDGGPGADVAQDAVEELAVRGDGVGRALEDAVEVEVVHEARDQPRRGGFIALHRIADEERRLAGALDRVALGHLRAARDPAEGRVEDLMHRHEEGVDGAGAHEDVEVGQHGNRKAESKKQKAKILAALAR